MYSPKYLKKWQRVSDYGGEDLSDWYILVSQTRDSFLLERTNFSDIKVYLGERGFEIAGNVEDCKADNAILLASFGHWACGWIEAIMIHESNDAALIVADNIKKQLDDYPIFDEESHSQAESDLQWDYVSQYVVKDYLDDNDIEYNNELMDKITSYILNHHDCEINRYDEVLLPDNLGLDSIIDRFQHVTVCPTCHDEIDNRSESCSCQMSLSLD